MGTAKNRHSSKLSFIVASVLLSCLVMGAPAQGQKGDNVIYNSSGPTSSSAFLDATAFCSSPGACSSSTDDFCVVLNAALHALTSAGGVVDARGLSPASTKSTSCASTVTTPFSGTYSITVPSTVLLPAGTIPLGKTWILPNGTKIIGRGAGSTFSSSLYSVTTLEAKSGFSSTMIQMGSSTLCPATGCTEVAVEDLALQASTTGANVIGILNGQSQDMSYVRRVSMYGIGGIGLKVWNLAHNSGPYSDISFDNAGLGNSTTECVELDVTTRGVHGLSCASETITPAAMVVVNSNNNTIKDVQIQGTSSAPITDGVQVTDTASSNVLFNISGGPGVTYVVHLVKSGSNAAQDISVMGAATSGGSGTYSIWDEVTSTTLADSYVAMYVLGVSGVSGNGYSRFTTSTNLNPNAVTWGTGNALPASCAKGSLFSCRGCTTPDLYVCTTGGTTGTWMSLP